MGCLGSKEQGLPKPESGGGQFLKAWAQRLVLCHFFPILLANNSSRAQIQGEKLQMPLLRGMCAKKLRDHVTKLPHLKRSQIQQWFHEIMKFLFYECFHSSWLCRWMPPNSKPSEVGRSGSFPIFPTYFPHCYCTCFSIWMIQASK